MMLTRRQRIDVLLWLTNVLLMAANAAVFAAMWFCCYSDALYQPFYGKGNYAVIAVHLALYVIFARLYGGFDLVFGRIRDLIYSHGVTALLTGCFMYVIVWLLTRRLPNALPLLLTAAVNVGLSVLWAVPSKRLVNRLLPPKRIALIYDNQEARKSGEIIVRDHPHRFELVRQIDINGGVEDAVRELESAGAEAVLLCGVGSSVRNSIVKYCIRHDIYAYTRPSIGDFLVSGARTVHLSNLPVMLCRRSTPAVWYLAAKRAADIVLSLCALIVGSPFMLGTAIAIKLYDHGPVLYKQRRLTKDRREFDVYKFRSMRVDAEGDGIARLSAQGDDRITPVGRFIRMVRLDETPQLLNILRGDMSIVGPRPERPEIAAQYETEMPEFALRLQVKAGLTGYAQVYGKYNTSPYDKLQMDLMYIGGMGIVMDLKIMFATVKILFMPESTEGVEKGKQTAAQKENVQEKTAV